MERRDGSFTGGMILIIFYFRGDAIRPHPPSTRVLVIRTIGNNDIILGGDFKQVRDPQLDKSGNRQGTPQTHTAITIQS